jgi:hypothetical protein
MKLQAVPAPEFQLFQEVAIKPAKPFMSHGELFEIPRPERGVIVGLSFTTQSYAEFFGQVSGWTYLIDADFNATAAADERWEIDCFNEDELTSVGQVAAVELLAA